MSAPDASATRARRVSPLRGTRYDAGSMAPRTWLLCGVPRSGSSLCCRLAGGAPDTVALSEPIEPRAFDSTSGPADACASIRAFAATTRETLLAEGRAPSVQVNGRLDDDRVSEAPSREGLRRPRGGPGEIRLDKPLSDDFLLLIKHNALFAALLGPLAGTFPTLGLVRNPVAVLASWQTVDLPVRQGRVPMGERFDPLLARTLDDEPDTLRRQVRVLDWFFARFRDHLPPERVLRYEDLVASGGLSLFRRLDITARPELLESRNANVLYDAATVNRILAAVQAAGGAWSAWYARWDCEQAAAAIRAAR